MPGLLSLVTDHEIYGSTRRPRYETHEAAPAELEFTRGDLIIHEERGIGRFLGMEALAMEGSTRDLLRFEYAGEQTLSVPPEQLKKIAPFKGLEGEEPALSRLHTEAWQNCVSKALESILKTAKSLKKTAGAKNKRKAPALQADPDEVEEFAAAFPYEETPSQKKAIAEVSKDLHREIAMERLLCGDVGFGKTEVAMRAFFQALSSGRQAALLAPTTVLARQHFDDFFHRMRPFGIKVAGLWGDCENENEIVSGLADGTILAVVGTHRLLSKDVEFHNLGLLVVDEEQSFGVAHKEKIAELSDGVHQLSLTATPIPRTTQLALSGVRDISLLDAPPMARRPVKTYLLEEGDRFIAAALMRELERDGQAFLLHNRVDELPSVAAKVEKLVPGARVAQAHGQMDDEDLARTIDDFLKGRYDVLVCTTIIESGIDFPNVNSIVIKDAQRFGLSQLYQIRGRVGRSHQQAYCYLMVPPGEELSERARRRLDAIHRRQGLGGGYQVALDDLEIRGAGDLLGEEQSGHIGKLGYTFYSELLQQALSNQDASTESAPEFAYHPPLDAHIPESYISPDSVRVSVYRRLAQCKNAEEVEELTAELDERFGTVPQSVTNLFHLHLLSLSAVQKGMTSIEERKSFGEREVVCLAGEEVVLTLKKAPKGAGLLDLVRSEIQGTTPQTV